MRILITGSRSKLGKALASSLAINHEVRTLDLPDGGGPAPDLAGDPRDREFAAQAIAGCDAVIHRPPLVAPNASPRDIVDAAACATYNLITTAPAGCRVILISNLRNFESYPADYAVKENWAPRPTSEVSDLSTYLAEITVRELARVRPIKAIVLRLGEVVDDEDVETPRRGVSTPVYPRWLHVEDAIQAVERALAFEPSLGGFQIPYWVFHIVGAGKRTPEHRGGGEMSVSWEEAGMAIRQALRVPSLPHPYEVFHLFCDNPHGKYSNEKMKQLLGWQPRDVLNTRWTRSFD